MKAGEDSGSPTPKEAQGASVVGLLVGTPARFYALLALAAFALFSLYHGMLPGSRAFEAPSDYLDGDALLVLGTVKTFGELPPPWDLHAERLNAPFGADWNDFPIPEKLVYYATGVLARMLGVGAATNLSLLLAQIAAAVAFAWTCLRLGLGKPVAFVAALLFAFCPFIVGRGTGGLPTAWAWHVPLLLYLVSSLTRITALPAPATRLGALGLMVVTALQSPYYAAMGLMLVALVTVRTWLLGRGRVAWFGLLLLTTGLGSYLLFQSNVELHAWSAGRNAAAEAIDLGPRLDASLKLPDLVMPWEHPLGPLRNFARAHYFEHGDSHGENRHSFLGLVVLPLFFALIGIAVARGLRGRWRDVPWQAWVVGYVLLFSLAGGLDYVVGALGLGHLAASCRYSVIIVAAVLLWGASLVQKIPGPRRAGASLLGVGLLALVELFGMRGPDFHDAQATNRRIVHSDRQLARDLERAFRYDSRIFELPVVEFPEARPVEKMGAYEHFRPYLWADSLGFSYGTQRGRLLAAWQARAEKKSPDELSHELKERGFVGILVNRKAYADGGKSIEDKLKEIARERLKSDLGDFVLYDFPEEQKASTRRRASFRFFPQGADPEPYTEKNGHLVDLDGWVSVVTRTSDGTYLVSLDTPVKKVLSIQLTAQSTSPDASAKIFDILYEGSKSPLAFRVNHVSDGALVDMPPGTHHSIMVTIEFEVD